MSERALVYGVAVAGLATLDALLKRGYDVVVVDDDATEIKSKAAAARGCELIERPSDSRLRQLVDSCDFVAPSPGVPEGHPVLAISKASSVPVRSELDLGYEWEMTRSQGPRPIVAVTGTDGKTTTVLMTEEILRRAGRTPVACGNTEIPFVEALDLDVDAFVIEATSFRLAFAESFRADASAWLNLAPDHLDWHGSMESYEASKARLWGHVRRSDAAIGCIDDPIVMRHLQTLDCRRFTFGRSSADYSIASDVLNGPHGPILEVARLYRDLPHDRTNALAASAISIESGLAQSEDAARALGEFRGPRHRIELVAEFDGVRYFDDSKATTPHAATTAIRGFESVVLIAGGRNKQLDLAPLADESARLRCVVAIGESADDIARVFSGRAQVIVAGSMHEAVEVARSRAQSGDVVLLSPGCTSLDWYSGYAERGEDFARCVSGAMHSMLDDEKDVSTGRDRSANSRTQEIQQ